jgi:hypothetical protein
MGRLHQLCNRTLDWCIDQRLLPPYTPLGRFVPEGGSRGALSFSRDEQMLMHYAPNRGALYTAVHDWQRAYTLLAAFLPDERAGRVWSVGSPIAPILDLEPPVLLEKIGFALARLGMSEQARNDGLGLASYRIEENWAILDLPEPLGKWYQKRGRARWNEQVSVVLEVQCTVRSIIHDGTPPRYATQLELELSAPGAPLIEDLRAELEKLFRPVPLALAGEHASLALRRALHPMMQRWLEQA